MADEDKDQYDEKVRLLALFFWWLDIIFARNKDASSFLYMKVLRHLTFMNCSFLILLNFTDQVREQDRAASGFQENDKENSQACQEGLSGQAREKRC